MSDNTGTATDNGVQQAEATPQAQAQPATKPEPGAIPYSRFAEVVEQRKGLESTLSAIIDGMVNELPEDMRDLVPNLPPTEKAAWIRSAKERGLFGKGSETDSHPANSPDAKRPGGKTPIDFDGMSPMQKLQFGFGHK